MYVHVYASSHFVNRNKAAKGIVQRYGVNSATRANGMVSRLIAHGDTGLFLECN
jgi:hypothetical protein